MKKKHVSRKDSREPSDSVRIVSESRDLVEFTAARLIQKTFRGFVHRYHAVHRNAENLAARRIQKAWREHKIREKLLNLRKVIALIKITRLIHDFRRRLGFRRSIQKLEKFEPLMTFFPAKCNAPNPPVRRRRGRSRRGGKRGRRGKGKVSRSDEMPTPMMPRRSNYRRSSGTPRKRKVLVELPPPWHSKDPRRLSQSQQSEMLYNQKNNVAWVKSDLIPALIRRINVELEIRDELMDKNEKFRARLVTKPFISAKPRNPTYQIEKAPVSITFIRETGMYALLTTQSVFYMRVVSFMDDQLYKKDVFDLSAPFFDVVVFPRSGLVYGIDQNWCLRLINGGKTVLRKQFHPEVLIPATKHFLSFDNIGFLWVNLIPQKGNLYCVDGVTLQTTFQVNTDSLSQVYRYFKNNMRMIPLALKEPVGFAGIFEGMTDVVLFSHDFSKSRALRHPNMKSFPIIRKSANKLFVWSADNVIYVYEMASSIEQIQLRGCFKVDHTPIDICATSEPDLIYISHDDCTLRIYLGGKCEHLLRFPESKMSGLERTFADMLLGPAIYTRSRPAFLIMSMHRFSEVPIHINAWSMSSRLAMVTVTFSNATLHSIWVYNNAQQVRCDEYDRLKIKDSIDTQVASVTEYKSEENKMLKRRNDFLDLFNFLSKFDAISNKGQLRNIFVPKPPSFSLTKTLIGYSLRSFYHFIPETNSGYYSAYEAFHFLKRSGILPVQISEFSSFLERFAPDNIKRALPNETSFNNKMPVKTSGYYNCVTDFVIKDTEILQIIDRINPIKCLKEILSVFTISAITDKFLIDEKKADKEKELLGKKEKTEVKDMTTPQRWVSLYEKNELNRRLNQLIALEDLVKHDLMGRVQHNIDEAFTKNMYDRMIPVPPIDIHQHANQNEIKNLTFSEKQNRNPLLDKKMHISIYHSWSVKTLFSRDKESRDLRVLHIPDDYFLTQTVQNHFEFIKKVSASTKKITSEIYAIADGDNNTTKVIITEDSKSLPLSHYLTIHSFLGANSRLIVAARSILSRVLPIIYQLHKCGIILRTLVPDNILLNAQYGFVTIGNVFDCQLLASTGRPNYLPLPKHFSHFSNPFLPPEYYYEPPRKWTTAFDVWQFGILLLYVLTGFLPKSYGSELMRHLDEDQRLRTRRVVMAESSPLDDPPLFPKYYFFYDWLKGCEVVLQGERASWVSDDGKCYITTDRLKPPSILELDHYHLLPYKNTKLKYDETRLYLEIIASCLQIEPEKRPSVEKLLRTIPFSTTNQASDILDQYMRQPNSRVFVNEFFRPALDNLTDASFPFALGIISALIFHDEMADEDASYSFPLDTRAAERVIKSLFDIKFMDRLILFVLNRIERNITYKNVNPNITFVDDAFNWLLHLLQRFVGAVEHGQGSLLNHVDEVVMTLLALYAANPRLRNTSESFLENPNSLFSLASTGSAATFVFTYHHVKPIVTSALQRSSYILNALKRTTEHNDEYYNSFLAFGDKVYQFANAMVHSIEKQRANAIFMLLQIWGNGQQIHITRLFLDFRVPQMAIHCFLNQHAKVEGARFVNEAFSAVKLKSFEPTYRILHSVITQSPVFLQCADAVRTFGHDDMKDECLELIRNIIFGNSASAVRQLVISDVFWSLSEQDKAVDIYNLLTEAICFASKFVLQIVFSSSHLRKILRNANMDSDTHFDIKLLTKQLTNIEETLEIAKRLSSSLFIRQSGLPEELKRNKAPLDVATQFLIKAIRFTIEESDKAAQVLDKEVIQSTRFDLKGTTYLKAKSTARNTDFADFQGTICEMCDVLLHLFRCICFYYKDPGSIYPKYLVEFILDIIAAPVPECHSMPHPAYFVFHCIQQMALHCLIDLPETSPIRLAMMTIQEIYPQVMLRDVMFVMHCIEKDIVEMQLITRYPKERQLRMKFFQTIMLDPQSTNLNPILRFISTDMLHNKVQFTGDTVLSQNYQFPIRSEAINMITFLFSVQEKYESSVKRLVDELVASKFVEEEKKLTDSNTDQQLSSTSILFLKLIMQNRHFFNERTLKAAKDLLETLCMRYTRDWMNISAFKSEENPRSKQNNNGNGSSGNNGNSDSKKSTPSINKNIKVLKARSIGAGSTFSPRKSKNRPPMATVKKNDIKSLTIGRPKTSFNIRKSAPLKK